MGTGNLKKTYAVGGWREIEKSIEICSFIMGKDKEMYKLYDINEKKLLDMSNNEQDIINTLAEYMKVYLNLGFEIRCDDETYKKILSVGDYYHYVNDYMVKQNTERLKQMSCMDLKREMLDLYDKPRARIKKLGGPHGKNN